MYITKEADYAMRIVHYLAAIGIRRDARTISEAVHVTLRFSLKILGKLSCAGIVRSYKGNHGGYELAHAPSDITLKDVLDAVDGPYALSRCLCGEGSDCSVLTNCAFQKELGQISDSVNRQLSEISFERLLAEEKCNCKC